MDKRSRAVEYFMKSITTGERTSAERAADYLAPNVEMDTSTQPGQPVGRERLSGKAKVLDRISGLWLATPGYMRAGWSDPETDGDGLKVTGTNGVTLTFSFDEHGLINHVLLQGGWGGLRYQEVETIPDAAKGLINNALANQTPISVTYVDATGQPHTSLRGSTCVYSPTQLAIWIRPADGGLPKAMANNNKLSLLYNDRKAGATLIIEGLGHIESDEEVRRRVFELAPEVEQTHDPERHGVALLIDVKRLQGGPAAGLS